MQNLVAFCSQPEAVSVVISGMFVRQIVSDKSVKFCSRLNCSPEIRPEAVTSSIFDRFSNFEKCRPEVAGDAISDVANPVTVKRMTDEQS